MEHARLPTSVLDWTIRPVATLPRTFDEDTLHEYGRFLGHPTPGHLWPAATREISESERQPSPTLWVDLTGAFHGDACVRACFEITRRSASTRNGSERSREDESTTQQHAEEVPTTRFTEMSQDRARKERETARENGGNSGVQVGTPKAAFFHFLLSASPSLE